MTPYKHQVEGASKAFEILKTLGLVYLVWEERTGKTLTAILTCEMSTYVKKVLVITQKQALPGWKATIEAYKPKVEFDVINYHQAHKVKSKDHQIVILDESHAFLGKLGYPGAIWRDVQPLTKDKYIIFMSATPNAQGSGTLFNQLKLSTWSPWARYRDFYRWFEDYGIPQKLHLGKKVVKVYTSVREDKVEKDIARYMIACSRSDIGFAFEPEDKVHYVELLDSTKARYRALERDKIIFLGDEAVTAATPTTLLTRLHQLEGGTLKSDDQDFILDNCEKIDYILKTFGDVESLVIFYNYKLEKLKLEKFFKKAKVLQGTSFAEGVDLSMYKDLVIYSMNFSTAKYTQRRARQANIKRETPIVVHYICVKGAVSSQVYETVAMNKKNFLNKHYEKGLL